MACARDAAAGQDRTGWGLVQERVQPGHRVHQCVGRARAMLVLPVHPQPLHFEPGRLGDVGGQPVGRPDQAVEPLHERARPKGRGD